MTTGSTDDMDALLLRDAAALREAGGLSYEPGESPRPATSRAYYFAGRYSRHPELRRYRDELAAAIPGATITSRWIDCHGGQLESSFTPDVLAADPSQCWVLGAHDLEDVDAAETIVSFTGDGGGGKGGRHVEHGYAIARGKRLVVIGPREHIFHTHPATEVYREWADFLAYERISAAQDRLSAVADGLAGLLTGGPT